MVERDGLENRYTRKGIVSSNLTSSAMLENFEPFKKEEQSFEIDSDKIAKEYAEKVRECLRDLKNKNADIHFESIDPDELTYDDLMIADKFQKGNLSKKEFNEYRERLQSYIDLAKRDNGENFNLLKDSRVNLSAWILNKMIISEFKEKHPEIENQK